MLIQPDSYIRLIKNCPLNNSYEHTLLFLSKVEQEEYFRTQFDGINFTKQSYQRYANNVLTIQASADSLYSCNYLMFKNTSFGNKWFYAFITSIEYVNNITARVYYELDIMQTWNLDYELHDCFVEREHSTTDNIGDNLVPENIDTGEYIYTEVEYRKDSARVTPFKDFDICILATFDKEYDDVRGGYYGTMYSGLAMNCFDNALDARNFLEHAVAKNKADGIVALFMVPHKFGANQVPSGWTEPSIEIGEFEYIKKNLSTIDGHKPRNNKLFTMPYNSLLVTNNEGGSATYGYEYFHSYPTVVDDNHVVFTVASSRVNSPEYGITPWFYKGLDYNHMERVLIQGTPQCSYNTNAYIAWLAREKVNLGIGTISDIAGAIGGLYSGSIGTTINSLSNTLNRIGQTYVHSTLPPTAKGHHGGGALNINTGIFGFSIYYCTIRKEFAEIIDGFFDRFGYATHKNKVPNIGYALKNGTNAQLRPYWNYIKTADVAITGSVPADDLNAIKKIYNNGITFWTKYVTIGNYSYNNKPR